MKASRIVIAVLVLMGVWGIGYTIKNREKTFGAEAQKEAETQKPEVEKCKAQLATIYKAWSNYRKDHKGAEPAIADLVKYIKDPEVFVCPTAARWKKMGKPLRAGSFEVGSRTYYPTYGFMWQSAQGRYNYRKLGEKAVLVNCTAHEEALYRAGYKRTMKDEAFSEENRTKLIPEVAAAKALVVVRTGTVEERAAGSE